MLCLLYQFISALTKGCLHDRMDLRVIIQSTRSCGRKVRRKGKRISDGKGRLLKLIFLTAETMSNHSLHIIRKSFEGTQIVSTF